MIKFHDSISDDEIRIISGSSHFKFKFSKSRSCKEDTVDEDDKMTSEAFGIQESRSPSEEFLEETNLFCCSSMPAGDEDPNLFVEEAEDEIEPDYDEEDSHTLSVSCPPEPPAEPVISPSQEVDYYDPEPENRWGCGRWLLIGVIALVILFLLCLILTWRDAREYQSENKLRPGQDITQIALQGHRGDEIKSFTTVTHLEFNNKGLTILTPQNARPRLVVGTDYLEYPPMILAVQAADVREDNGHIAGTFVLDGELKSKGEAKAGYCAIINGEITIGAADATPLLEQALNDGGYFFRQYPLVIGGQIMENKPKGKAIRKALAEINGKIHVVISDERLTFHDFSQLLIDAGARNAIYLVGASSYGFYITDHRIKEQIGDPLVDEQWDVNYIVWEKE